VLSQEEKPKSKGVRGRLGGGKGLRQMKKKVRGIKNLPLTKPGGGKGVGGRCGAKARTQALQMKKKEGGAKKGKKTPTRGGEAGKRERPAKLGPRPSRRGGSKSEAQDLGG